jgi:hypothetical protein
MRRPDLNPDCANCAAICCVATSFEASDDFAFDKPAGVACTHLLRDRRCAIHDQLAVRGCSGCAVYDCYGAGPRATRMLADAQLGDREHQAVFLALRDVHELLWLLTEAAELCPSSQGELAAQLALEIAALDALAQGSVRALLAADLHRRSLASRALLRRVGDALGGRRRWVRALVVLD